MATRARWTLLLAGSVTLALVMPAAVAGCDSDIAVAIANDAAADVMTPPAADASTDGPRVVDVDAGPVKAPYGLDVRPANPSCKAPARPPAASPVTFTEVFANTVLSDSPIWMAQAPGDPTRWFIAARHGTLFSVPTAGGARSETGKLQDLAGIVLQPGGEGGFLGFAFHPKFAQNGRVYVSWTSADGPTFAMRSRVGYMTSTDNGVTFTSYTNILTFERTSYYHNGGGIAFGNEGYLYLSFGDGGGTDSNAQLAGGFLGKILRIDVDKAQPYAIPPDNPFANTPGFEPATFAFGFRNPFRLSIDRATNDLWVGDVGHALWEEIDVVKAGGNYGWPCREGKHDHNPVGYYGATPAFCPTGGKNLADPIVEHEHIAPDSYSRAITGGVVYRGKAIPSLNGTYVYGDFQTRELFALSYDAQTGAAVSQVINPAGPAGGWVHFAEDTDGEIHALDLYGHIYKMMPAAPPSPSTFPARLSQTGCVNPAVPTSPAAGVLPFDVNAALWSDGATKERFLAVPDGKTMTADADGHLEAPAGSVLMKTFALDGKPVETRLLMRHDDGEWAGYSYEWLDDGSDAILLPSSKRKTVGARSWFYPSRTDCMRCHTQAAGRSLGLEIRQLDRDLVYPSTHRIANQMATLAHIGIVSGPLPAIGSLSPIDGAGSVEARARSYLHVNCANCHRPSGGGGGDLDLRYSTPFAATKTCNVDGERGDFGVAGAKRIVPASPSTSLLSLRPRALGAGRMPPLGSDVVDATGLGVVDTWIHSLAPCP